MSEIREDHVASLLRAFGAHKKARHEAGKDVLKGELAV
jgi:hypothetical protein